MFCEDTVLNPALFARLQLYYGRDDVEVVNRGHAIDWELRYEKPYGNPDGPRRPIRHIINGGEEYKVRCKRCCDHRARLYIGHKWGVFDDATNSRNLWLLNCFNENCYAEYQAKKELYEAIWGVSLAQLQRRAGQTVRDLRRGVISERPRDELSEIRSPGPIIPLDVLAERHPHHKALCYLAERGFDPIQLSRYWGVGYCITSRYRLAANRIFIPIQQQGMQVGWQMRYIGNDVEGVPFNAANVPKYWTAPEMPRRLVAYNIERALQHSTLVVVEGTSDVWNVGRRATAILGVSASEHVIKLIADGMRRHGDQAVIIVALDPEPPRRQNPRPAPHPIDTLVAKLGRYFPPERILPLWLPTECDPGSIDRRLFIQLAREQAATRGLTLDFNRPKLPTTAGGR